MIGWKFIVIRRRSVFYLGAEERELSPEIEILKTHPPRKSPVRLRRTNARKMLHSLKPAIPGLRSV